MTRTYYQCTKDSPWKPEYGRYAEHEDTYEVPDSQRDNYPCGDLVTIACKNCGHRWEKELPQ